MVEAFHGTNQPFRRFEKEHLASATMAGSAAAGFYFTTSLVEAWQYAENAARRVFANVASHRLEYDRIYRQMAAAEARKNWDLVDALTGELERHEFGAMYAKPADARVLKVILQIDQLAIEHFGGVTSVGTLMGRLERAKQAGADGVLLKDIGDSPRGDLITDQYVVFSHEQIQIVDADVLGNEGRVIGLDDLPESMRQIVSAFSGIESRLPADLLPLRSVPLASFPAAAANQEVQTEAQHPIVHGNRWLYGQEQVARARESGQASIDVVDLRGLVPAEALLMPSMGQIHDSADQQLQTPRRARMQGMAP